MAQEILSLEGTDEEELISKIETYVESLDADLWATPQQAEVFGLSNFDNEFQGLLQEFSELHSKLVEKALAMKGEVAARLRDHKRKGKGILAYERMDHPMQRFLFPRKG